MSHGVETAMAACQCHEARHATRLAPLFGRLREQPVQRMPTACHGWAETVAASRLLDHPAIGAQERLSGHHHATLERLRTQEVVFWGQDTPLLDDGTTRPKQGMGTVQVKVREEHRLHPTVALTPARLHLGGLGLKMGQRPEPAVAQERHRTPLAEPASARGLAG